MNIPKARRALKRGGVIMLDDRIACPSLAYFKKLREEEVVVSANMVLGVRRRNHREFAQLFREVRIDPRHGDVVSL